LADWEDTFRAWAKPLSDTEQTRCENAEGMIKDAIRNDDALKDLEVSVFAQGSYRANTNVRLNSDVDICVCCHRYFFADYSDGITAQSIGNSDSNFTYSDFKRMVWDALVKKFGRDGVTWGNKAFDVHENSYRIDADVVPTFEHRRYYRDREGVVRYHQGVELRPDTGIAIKNWPEHTYENGVDKNKATGFRYKAVIRILKRLRNKMQAEKIAEAQNIASFLIECLVWNTPNDRFGNASISEDVKSVLNHTWFSTYAADRSSEWGEVNELKYLFRTSQPWTLKQANDFLWEANKYLGF
jgi:hypothetical protein